jgi:Transposase DDE domain group 1
LGVNGGNGDRRVGRLEIRADDPSLTPFAGLAVSGELVRSLRLVELIDAEIVAEGRVAPFKQRRRGVSPGQLIVSLAECQLVGGDCFDDIEVPRADRAGARLRAIAEVPSAPCARQLAARLKRCQIHAAERALARAGQALDREVGRDRGEEATIDLDATRITVYGPGKQGARRTRTGELAYAPHIATWAQRGRALTGELVGGNQERLSGAQCATIARRAIRLLGADHGPVDFRIDSAYYQLKLLEALRKARARFSVSVPRNQAMWRIAAGIPEDAWSDATDMPAAQITETTYKPEGWKHEPLRLIVRRVPFSAERVASGSVRARRRNTIPPEQLQLAIDGKVETVYGYSFILSDHPAERDTAWVEHHHRHRAQIEERLKDAKLGQALRHLPCRNIAANRTWMLACLCALNITAMTCEICPAAAISTQTPEQPAHQHEVPEQGEQPLKPDLPLRRHAKALRHILFCVPARIVRTGRRTILRLPEGFRHADVFAATYDAAWALDP